MGLVSHSEPTVVMPDWAIAVELSHVDGRPVEGWHSIGQGCRTGGLTVLLSCASSAVPGPMHSGMAFGEANAYVRPACRNGT